MKKNKAQSIPPILVKFASQLGTSIRNHQLKIPAAYGNGYCAGFVLNEHISMLISNYELKQDLLIQNPELDINKRVIFFKFQHIFPETDTTSSTKNLMQIPSVLIATSRIHTDDVISIHSNTATINIEVDAGYLNGLFDLKTSSPLVQSLLQNTQPLLFEQIVYPSLQKIVDEIVARQVDKTFELFFLRIKAEELICRLLMELEQRDSGPLYPLNSNDVQTIYKIKEQMLQNLSMPPVIEQLALDAHMSATKLKRLFKQIFGDSIFNYYQTFRLQEAARLLKAGHLSVADVGYELGFSNLSHFARVFKVHTGFNPKRYSKA